MERAPRSYSELARGAGAGAAAADPHPVYLRLTNKAGGAGVHGAPLLRGDGLHGAAQEPAAAADRGVGAVVPAGVGRRRAFINGSSSARSATSRRAAFTSRTTRCTSRRCARPAPTPAGVEHLVELVRNHQHYRRALQKAQVPAAAAFVADSVSICLTGKNHEVAACTSCSAENLIPDMFRQIVERLRASGETGLGGLVYHLVATSRSTATSTARRRAVARPPGRRRAPAVGRAWRAAQRARPARQAVGRDRRRTAGVARARAPARVGPQDREVGSIASKARRGSARRRPSPTIVQRPSTRRSTSSVRHRIDEPGVG